MWRSDEINAWLAELPIRPLKGDDRKISPRRLSRTGIESRAAGVEA
jgi:hypothetical protein